MSKLFDQFKTDESIQWQSDYLMATVCRGNETCIEGITNYLVFFCEINSLWISKGITTWWNLGAKKVFGSESRALDVCNLFMTTPCQRLACQSIV